jgi:hypothetical protein
MVTEENQTFLLVYKVMNDIVRKIIHSKFCTKTTVTWNAKSSPRNNNGVTTFFT